MAWQVRVKDRATVQDTVNLILQTIRDYAGSADVADACNRIGTGGKTKREFTRDAFDFVCRHVRYEKDSPGHERVTTPGRLLRDGVGDCKKITVLLGCIFKRLNIPFYLKVVSYTGYSWEHIYVIVPTKAGYLTVDPVNHCRYNSEVSHKRATVFDLKGKSMRLSLLGSPNSQSPVRSLNSSLDRLSGCRCSSLGAIIKLGPDRWENRAKRHPMLFITAYLGNDNVLAARGANLNPAQVAKVRAIQDWIARNTRDKYTVPSTLLASGKNANAEVWNAISVGFWKATGYSPTQYLIKAFNEVRQSKAQAARVTSTMPRANASLGTPLLAISTIVAGIVKGLQAIWKFFGKLFGDGGGEPGSKDVMNSKDIEEIFGITIPEDEKPEKEKPGGSGGNALTNLGLAIGVLSLAK